jgi:hypothetical protein
VDAVLATSNQVHDPVDPGFGPELKRTTRYETYALNTKNDGPEQDRIFSIERTVDEYRVLRIQVWDSAAAGTFLSGTSLRLAATARRSISSEVSGGKGSLGREGGT